VCRARQSVALVLFVSLAVACGQTAASPPPGDGTAPAAPDAPTYTPYPTYTLYPTYTPASPATELESLIWPKGPRDDVIAWADAGDFVGTEMIVEGTVVRTHNSGKAVFLDFAENQQEAFSVVIFPEDWDKFPRPPEALFYGREIRAQGLIQLYEGAPEIIVREPWQIEVGLTLGAAEACECGTPSVIEIVVTATPSETVQLAPAVEPTHPAQNATEAPPAIQVVGWQNAADFNGQTVTVEGQVVATYNSGKVVFLNFDEDYRQTFKIVIFPNAWPLFPQPPEDMYRGRLVRVTGQVQIYQGAPEIIIETPEAIQILE